MLNSHYSSSTASTAYLSPDRLIKFVVASVLILAFVSCSRPDEIPLSLPKSGPVVERGKQLVKGLAACGFCHGEKRNPQAILSGGLPSFDRYGEVLAPNLTTLSYDSAVVEGGEGWSALDFVRALRTNQRPDGSRISQEVHAGYDWLSDEDLHSMVAYLRTLPPVKNVVARRDVDFIDRNTTGFFTSEKQVQGYVPVISKQKTKEYGRYLADRVARCGYCHNGVGGLLSNGDYLVGGQAVRSGQAVSSVKGSSPLEDQDPAEKIAPGIIGMGGDQSVQWGDADWKRFFKQGITPEGRTVDPDYCPIRFYKLIADEELELLVEYLRGLAE